MELTEERIESLVDAAGIASLEIKEDENKENTTKESNESNEEDQETKKDTQEPTENTDDSEKDAEDTEDSEEESDDPKGVKKRIDKLTKFRREAEEERDALKKKVAELNEKLEKAGNREVDEPKKRDDSEDSQYILPKEEQVKIFLNKQIEAIKEEDKNKPIEERRIMSDDEANDLMIENPTAYQRYLTRSDRLVNEISGAINKALEPKQKPEENVSDGSDKLKDKYNSFVKEYPDLNYAPILQKSIEAGIDINDEEKFLGFIKKENSVIGDFFEFLKENSSKYTDNYGQAASDFYKKVEKDKVNKTLEENEALKLEIERLKSLDSGVTSTVSSSGKSGKGQSEKENDAKIARLMQKAGF